MLSKVRWSTEEDITIRRVYPTKNSVVLLQDILKNRTAAAIYARAGKLGLRKPARILPINVADFSSKGHKRLIERETASLITQHGGWFGIPGPAIKEHFDTFKGTLRANSPFVAVEENSMQFNKMSAAVGDNNKITLIKGELFDILKSYSKVAPRVPLFSYGHLDFCKTVTVLIREYSLLENLVWLFKWNQLKSEFYLDISVSRRPDGEHMYNRFFQYTVPLIFEAAGWEVIDPRNLKTRFVLKYRDGNPMANALFKLVKKSK